MNNRRICFAISMESRNSRHIAMNDADEHKVQYESGRAKQGAT